MNSREISHKLVSAKLNILEEYPFFGRLLSKLRIGLDNCGTAYTDMKYIVFDPAFATRLSVNELKCVMLHEVLHCALRHCTRCGKKHHFIYNVACDIVVNSTILEMLDKAEITIDGNNMMHLAPDFSEGREHTAEEVYYMLVQMSPEDFESMYALGTTDNHEKWEGIDGATLEDLWNYHIKEAARATSESGKVPGFFERYLSEVEHTPGTNWRQVLHDFIQFDKSDYDFSQPDKRFSQDMILPSFCDNVYGATVEKLWFFVDTSGSVSNDVLSVAYQEVKGATDQIDNLSGVLWFFDAVVYEPNPFASFDDILSVKPKGGGGTNFGAIFQKLKENENDLPNVIVIITDGYDIFPDESEALGIPVIWIIVDSDVVPPWGEYTFIST